MQALKYADQSLYNALGAAVFAELLQVGIYVYQDYQADSAMANENYGQQLTTSCVQSNADGTMDKSVGSFLKAAGCSVVQAPVIAWKDIGSDIGGSVGSGIEAGADITDAAMTALLNPLPPMVAAITSLGASFFIQDQALVVVGSAAAGVASSYALTYL